MRSINLLIVNNYHQNTNNNLITNIIITITIKIKYYSLDIKYIKFSCAPTNTQKNPEQSPKQEEKDERHSSIKTKR